MKYNTVIFDLDGTLLNTLEDLGDSVNHALKSFGYPERTYEEVRCFVGNGIKELMFKAVPKGTDEETALKISALNQFTYHIVYIKLSNIPVLFKVLTEFTYHIVYIKHLIHPASHTTP